MQLPSSLRDLLVEGVDGYLKNFSARPDGEAVANFVIEELEVWADDEGLEDLTIRLEESGQLEQDFAGALEDEMSSNDEFEYTGEEVTSLIEKLCGIEWVDDADFDLGDEPAEADDLSEEV